MSRSNLYEGLVCSSHSLSASTVPDPKHYLKIKRKHSNHQDEVLKHHHGTDHCSHSFSTTNWASLRLQRLYYVGRLLCLFQLRGRWCRLYASPHTKSNAKQQRRKLTQCRCQRNTHRWYTGIRLFPCNSWHLGLLPLIHIHRESDFRKEKLRKELTYFRSSVLINCSVINQRSSTPRCSRRADHAG